MSGYAKLIGCDVVIIHRAIAAKKIPEDCFERNPSNGFLKIDVAKADAAWGNHYRQSRKKINGVRPDPPAPIVEPVANGKQDTGGSMFQGMEDADLPQVTANLSYAEADRIGKIAATKLAILKLKEAEGSLVSVETIEKVFFEHARSVRDNLMAMPDRIIDELISFKNRNEAHIFMQAEIDKVLNSLSKLPEYRV